jgi:hypothetical protein
MAYTYLDQVLSDYLGYIKVSKNSAFTLADVPTIAIDRWDWLVKNWELRFYPNFKRKLPKSDFFIDLLKSLNNEIITQKLFPTTSTNPFLNSVKFIKYKPILSYISLSDIGLAPAEIIVLKEEQKRLQNLSVTDFKNMTFFLRNSAASAVQTVGLGDDDGVLVQGFSLTEAQRGYSTQELEQINDVFELADEIDGIIYYLQQKTVQQPNLLAVANRNTDPDTQVVFNQAYTSAIAVPFVESLESMALKYLGSKDNWFEIATINNLQPPFVDKTGTKEYLLGPGTLASVKISTNQAGALKVGTKVKVGSYTIREETRSILKIVKFDDGTMILSLSGEQDLSKLKLSEKPYVKVYKPQTANENSLLLVPVSAQSPLLLGKQPSLDVLKKLDKALLDFGVDIRRDEKTGELRVGKNGDFDIIYGMPAVRQAIYSLLSTNINELPFHPEYGIPFANVIGERFYGNIELAAAFSEILQSVILADGRYSNVVVQNLTVNETSVSINLIVTVDGSNVIIPLSFVSG